MYKFSSIYFKGCELSLVSQFLLHVYISFVLSLNFWFWSVIKSNQLLTVQLIIPRHAPWSWPNSQTFFPTLHTPVSARPHTPFSTLRALISLFLKHMKFYNPKSTRESIIVSQFVKKIYNSNKINKIQTCKDPILATMVAASLSNFLMCVNDHWIYDPKKC